MAPENLEKKGFLRIAGAAGSESAIEVVERNGYPVTKKRAFYYIGGGLVRCACGGRYN